MRHPTPFHPFTGRDVPWLVDRQAEHLGDKTFLVWESFAAERRSWSFAEFAEETRAYAAGLAAQGITANDVVVIHLDNCPQFLFAWYACARIGALVVTTNTNSSVDELSYFIGHCGAVAAITQPKLLATVREAAGPALRWIACTATDADAPPENPLDNDIVAFETLRGNAASAPKRSPDPLRPNSVQYTSGTTARPKGVVWTHANALWSGRVGSAHLGLTSADVHMCYFPLFHTNALAWSHLGTFSSGGTLVLLPRFSASRFWEIAVRNRATWCMQVAFTLKALLATEDPSAHHFRFWGMATDLSVIKNRWGIKTAGLYGMSETVVHNSHSELAFMGTEGSMGFVAAEYEFSIRRDDGSHVDYDEPGRLWLRGMPGISLFAGYLHNPEATQAAFDQDGWFDTGDEVKMLPHGEMFFVGRAKDMLRVGGENVAALEIETAIMGVGEVAEVAVVGRPDDMLDEVPVAFIVARGSTAGLADAIHAHCEMTLSSFKRPREIRFVDQLPKGLLDKVLKKTLREMALLPEATAQTTS